MELKKLSISSLTSEFDYILLKKLLAHYRHPRVKINQLIKTEQIVRVKKGLYVKGGQNYSPLVLANMIYGPSYVSQEFALSIYNLIPERVMTVTSMTIGRNKEFSTPCGNFSYEHLSPHLYIHGIRRVELDLGRAYLIATPEKALVDSLWRLKGLRKLKELEDYLEGEMRLGLTDINQIKMSKVTALAKIYNKPVIHLLAEYLRNRMLR